MQEDMFAIVEVAGQQFKVEKDDKIFVNRLPQKEGEKITVEKVLLVEDGGKTLVGTPVVKGYEVKATVITHLKGDKVKVFKKKRRKGYQKLNGHRQLFTEILIESIGKAKAAPKAKATAKKKEDSAEEKPAAKTAPKAKNEAAADSKTKAAPKKATAKSGTEKKKEEPKATAQKTTKAATAKKNSATAKGSTAKKRDDKEKKEEK